MLQTHIIFTLLLLLRNIFSNTNKQNLSLSDFSPSFCEIKNFVFTKVSSFHKESFTKTKREFCQNFCVNFCEKTKAKTFVQTLVSSGPLTFGCYCLKGRWILLLPQWLLYFRATIIIIIIITITTSPINQEGN
jgi:hypothetical protein